MIYLKNVMEEIVYIDMSLAKTGVFIDIYTYLQLSFSIQVFSIRWLWLPFLLITVAELEGKKGGSLPLTIIVSSLINKKSQKGTQNFLLWFVIFQLYSLGTFVFMLKFQSFRVFRQRLEGISQGSWVL